MSGVTLFEIVATCAVIAFIVGAVAKRSVEVTFVRSSVDGRSYLVQNLSDKQQAADLLARVNEDTQELIRQMQAKHPDNSAVKRLAANFNPDSLSEAGQGEVYTSYTLNKGERIVLCLRTRDSNNALHEANLVFFVMLHELAHLMTRQTGHGTEFWDNNRMILQNAIDTGLYKKVDFDAQPAKYCGIRISSSVL